MATSNAAGRLHVLPSLHFYEERSSCRCVHRCKARYNHTPLPSFFPQRSSVGICGHGKLVCESSSSSNVRVVVPVENLPGRIDTPVDAGIKLSNVEFNPDILDITYRHNDRAAPPVVPPYPPADENGPTELDFEIYASNSMANYEPPPPPRIPFSAPFEDFYDEAIGVDYINREERPANSLLQFLDSLNGKEVEGGGANMKTPLFSSGSSHIAEGKPLGQDSSAEGMDVVRGKQEKLLSSSIKTTEELLEQPSVSLQGTTSVLTSMDDRISSSESAVAETPLDSQSSTALASKSYASEVSLVEKQSDSISLVELRGSLALSTSDQVMKEAQGKVTSQSGIQSESRSSVPKSSSAGLSGDLINSHTPAFPTHEFIHPIDRNLEQRVHVYPMDGTGSRKNTESSKMRVDQMHKGASADTGWEDLTSRHALVAPKEASPMSQFYVPQDGDLVLGTVTFMNDQKVDLEIGAELSALMPTRDLQPHLQQCSSMLYEISSKDGSSIPFGESFLVKDDISVFPDNGMVEIGTIVIAEVIGKTIIDGRAIISCKAPAQKLAWHRIDQLMRLGEAVQMKITQWNEGGLLGNIEGIRAFIPRSELLQKLDSTALLRNYVGTALSVAVIQSNRQRLNIVASEVQAWMSKFLQVGTVHDVTVTRVHTYGMQVEVDNTKIRGFVHKTNFSKEFVTSAANYFAEGDKARVMVIKGRDPTKLSFSLTDLEKENGLLLRDKEQVFRDAEEMGRRFRERLSEQETKIYGVAPSGMSCDYQEPEIANLAWLHLKDATARSGKYSLLPC